MNTQQKDTETYRTLENTIELAYESITDSADAISRGLDMDNYDQCYSAANEILEAIDTVYKSRRLIDTLDVNWDEV